MRILVLSADFRCGSFSANGTAASMRDLQLVYKDDQCIVLHDIWTVKTIRRQDKNALNDTDVQATWVWKRSIRA